MTKILSLFFCLLLSFQVTFASEGVPSFDNHDDWLLTNDKVQITNLYPNPAVDYIAFRYHLLNPQAKVKIIVRNILGSEIEHYDLSNQAQQLKIDTENYKAGMYYFTISIDGKHEVTKKFLVKK